MEIERPLDMLNNLKGMEVAVCSKEFNTPIEGILIAFDIHLNIVIEISKVNKFIRGDSIVSIEPLIKNN